MKHTPKLRSPLLASSLIIFISACSDQNTQTTVATPSDSQVIESQPVQDTVSASTEALEKNVQEIEDGVTQAVNEAQDTVQDTLEEVTEAANNALSDGVGTVDSAQETVAQTTLSDSGSDSTVNQVSANAQKVTEAASEAAESPLRQEAAVASSAADAIEAVPSKPVFEAKSGSWVKKTQSIQGQWRLEQRGGDVFLVLSDDFKTRNAPDLKFVLSNQSVEQVNNKNAMQEASIVALLKSNKGAQEYKLPGNYGSFKTLLLHCQKYTKLWGAASLD